MRALMTWRRSCSPVHAGRSLWGTTRCLCLLRSFGAALCREALSGLLRKEGPATRLDSVLPRQQPAWAVTARERALSLPSWHLWSGSLVENKRQCEETAAKKKDESIMTEKIKMPKSSARSAAE